MARLSTWPQWWRRANERKIGFKSITENIDTTTSGGKLVFHIFGALAEFERDIIQDRTKAGLNAARSRGRLGGRPKAKMLDNPKKVTLAQSLYDNKNNTIEEICRTLHISRATLYRYIQTKKPWPSGSKQEKNDELQLNFIGCSVLILISLKRIQTVCALSEVRMHQKVNVITVVKSDHKLSRAKIDVLFAITTGTSP